MTAVRRGSRGGADPDGKQRKRTFPRRTDADRFLKGVEADKLRGTYVDPTAGRVTVAEYGEQRWLPSLVHVRPTTRDLYQAHLRNHVIPALGGHPLGSLRRTDCKAFVAALSNRLAPATVGTVYAVLRSLVQAAVDDGLIASNPCARVPLPRVEQRVVEPLPAKSVIALAEAMPARYALAVWLGAGAGLREGEALGLTAARVDFLRRRVHVEEQLQGVNGAEPTLCPPKTRASRRVVSVDDVVLEAVTSHMQRWSQGPYGLLITNRLGRPAPLLVRRLLAGGGSGGRASRGDAVPRPAPLLCLGAHRRRAAPQGDPGPARARHDRRDDGHLRAPVPGLRGGRARRSGPAPVPRPCPRRTARRRSRRSEALEGTSRPVSRILCRETGPRSRAAAIHLRAAVADSLVRPTRELGRATLERSLFGLAPGGVCRAARVAPGAGGLLHHRFTLTAGRSRWRSAFCGTFPRVTPGGCYPPPCPMESGLSSARFLMGSATRPPGRLVRASGYRDGDRSAPVVLGPGTLEPHAVPGVRLQQRELPVTTPQAACPGGSIAPVMIATASAMEIDFGSTTALRRPSR